MNKTKYFKFKNVKFLVSNNYQQSIDSMTYRTTINDQLLIFSLSFIIILFLFHLLFNHFNVPFFYQLKEYLFNSNAEKLDPYLSIRMNTILIFDLVLSIILSFIFAPKFIIGQIIDEDAPRFDLENDGLKSYYDTEKKHSELDMKIINNFILSKRNRETSFLLLGAPGSGKTQLINKWVNHLLHEKRKMIIHDPKGDFADLLVQYNSNDVFIIAPWYKQTKALHFGKIVFSKDLNELSLNIDLFISSFFPRIDKGGNSNFFEDGARETLKAVVFKICDEKKDQWTEKDILDEIMNYKTSADYLKLSIYINSIKQYYEGENTMAQSIRGSMSYTLAKLELLKNFWKDQPIEKRISLDDYILDKTKYKHLILMNDIKYFNVAQSVISFSINYMTKFVLSQEYLEFSKMKKKTNNGNFELYFILDEFSSFAKFLDIPSFNQLSDLGRQAGIRLIASLQKYLQTSEFCKTENEMKNFLANFPNRLIGAFASEDKEILNQLFGSYKIRELKTATNINGAGTSNNLSGAEKEIKNESSLLQNKLGVKKIKGKLKANFLIKTISNPIMAIIPIEIRDELEEIRKELKIKQENEFKQKRFKKAKNRIEQEEIKSNEISLLNTTNNENKNDIIEELSKKIEEKTINNEEEKIILEQKNDNTIKEQFKENEEIPLTSDDVKIEVAVQLLDVLSNLKNENKNIQIGE